MCFCKRFDISSINCHGFLSDVTVYKAANKSLEKKCNKMDAKYYNYYIVHKCESTIIKIPKKN